MNYVLLASFVFGAIVIVWVLMWAMDGRRNARNVRQRGELSQSELLIELAALNVSPIMNVSKNAFVYASLSDFLYQCLET